jgi:hypothetical protein
MTWKELVAKVRVRRPEMSHLGDVPLCLNELERLEKLQELPTSELTGAEIELLKDIPHLIDFMS